MKEHFWVKSRNKRLSVMLHTPDRQPEDVPVIVCCHGFTGDKVGYNQLTLNLANALEQAGFAVVRFDFLGSGDSEGEFAEDTFISGWQQDLENILGWLREQPRYRNAPKILYGHSLGGLIVLTRKDYEGDIRGGIVFAPTTCPVDTFRNIIFGPELWGRACSGEEIANFYGRGFRIKSQFVNDLLQYRFDPLAAARQLSIPMLIVHGAGDTSVPVGDSDRLAMVYGGPREYVILEADHLATGHQAELQKTVRRWVAGLFNH